MGRQLLILAVFVALVCVAQGLRCNYCMNIDKGHPICDQVEERECSIGLDKCIRIRMHNPAYGEVRRCASSHECEAKVPPLVDRDCCSSDLCN